VVYRLRGERSYEANALTTRPRASDNF